MIDKEMQAREDALDALLVMRGIPGMEHVTREGTEAIKQLWRQAAQVDSDNAFVFQIERDVVEKGAPMAVGTAWVLSNMPRSIHGRVALTFEGWSDDPRELFEIQSVVDCCRVLLLGSLTSPSKKHAQGVLKVLINEVEFSKAVGNHAFDIAGQYWLISTAFRDEVMSRTEMGLHRNASKAVQIHKWLHNKGPPPTEEYGGGVL